MPQKTGFTILEMSIVIVILVILSTLILVSVSTVREGGRNAKRVAQLKDMQQSLALYFRDQGVYPSIVTAGSALTYGSNTYADAWPANPTPRNDGSCPDSDYVYTTNAGYASYSVQFCLSSAAGDVGPGTGYAIPGQILSCLPDCTRSCDTGSDGCGGTCSNAASCASGETCYFDHCIKN